MKERIIKIEAKLRGSDQYISWSRENIGEMIQDIPKKIERENIYHDVKITYEQFSGMIVPNVFFENIIKKRFYW